MPKGWQSQAYRNVYEDLVEKMDPSIRDKCFARCLITTTQKNDLSHQTGTTHNRNLLALLETQDNKKYEVFCQILLDNDIHLHDKSVAEMRKGLVGSKTSGVPGRHQTACCCGADGGRLRILEQQVEELQKNQTVLVSRSIAAGSSEYGAQQRTEGYTAVFRSELSTSGLPVTKVPQQVSIPEHWRQSFSNLESDRKDNELFQSAGYWRQLFSSPESAEDGINVVRRRGSDAKDDGWEIVDVQPQCAEEESQQGHSGSILIIVVNFDPSMHHLHHPEAWDTVNSLVKWTNDRRAPDSQLVLEFVESAPYVDHIESAARIVEELGLMSNYSRVVGVLVSHDCNSLAFFHSEQSNTYKPVTRALAAASSTGGCVVVVSSDADSRHTSQPWISHHGGNSLLHRMQMQAPRACFDGRDGMILSWHRRARAVHAKAILTYVLHGQCKPGIIYLVGPCPQPFKPLCLMPHDGVPVPTEEEHTEEASVVSTDTPAEEADDCNLLSSQVENDDEPIRQPARDQPENIYPMLLYTLSLLTYWIPPPLVVPIRALQYVLFRAPMAAIAQCPSAPVSVSGAVKEEVVENPPLPNVVNFFLVYTGCEGNPEIELQVRRFQEQCIPQLDDRRHRYAIRSMCKPYPWNKLPTDSEIQQWLVTEEDRAASREYSVAVLFKAADDCRDMREQLTEEVDHFINAGIDQCVVAAMFDEKPVLEGEDSSELSASPDFANLPCPVVSWWCLPSKAVASELASIAVSGLTGLGQENTGAQAAGWYNWSTSAISHLTGSSSAKNTVSETVSDTPTEPCPPPQNATAAGRFAPDGEASLRDALQAGN